MKWIDWFEKIPETVRVVIFTLCCTGVFPSSTRAQTHQPDPSTRGFLFGGQAAVIGANPDQFDLNGLLPHFDVALTARRADFEAACGAIDTCGAQLSVGGGVLYFLSEPPRPAGEPPTD